MVCILKTVYEAALASNQSELFLKNPAGLVQWGVGFINGVKFTRPVVAELDSPVAPSPDAQ